MAVHEIPVQNVGEILSAVHFPSGAPIMGISSRWPKEHLKGVALEDFYKGVNRWKSEASLYRTEARVSYGLHVIRTVFELESAHIKAIWA
jgi:hypothetical protein